ncbi:MAG: hypothetical protein ACJA0H_000425 [Francisellaceae bacterium]|jgi:hypothetical protein
MLVVYLLYWAFFAWLFNDNFIVDGLFSLLKSGYYDVCKFIDPTDVCQLQHIIENFQGVLGFIVASFLMIGYKENG